MESDESALWAMGKPHAFVRFAPLSNVCRYCERVKSAPLHARKARLGIQAERGP